MAEPLAADVHTASAADGRIVLDFGGRIAGGGLILSVEKNNHAPAVQTSPNNLEQQAARLTGILEKLSPGQRLAKLREEIAGKITFTTSFGLEDQVLLHLIAEQQLDIDVVTLDTGRLFNETYDVWSESELRYGRGIHAIAPHHEDLERLIQDQGINGFYRSLEARQACCDVRKIRPLRRALEGATAWITGLRADQSLHRSGVSLVEADTRYEILKVSPLIEWTRVATLDFAKANNVLLSTLHDKGFTSIGCAPCTRATSPSEPERAGRWWWEQGDKKECGLHVRTARAVGLR